MIYSEFLVHAAKNLDNRGPQRVGQFYMNELWKIRPDLHNRILSTEFDPFHNDNRLAAFFSFLEMRWDEE